MKRNALLTVLLALALTACDKKPPEKPFVPDPIIPPSGTLPPGHPPVNGNNPTTTPSNAPNVEQTQKATVVSTIDIPQFTYLEVTQDKQTRWLAAATIAAKKGDVIQFDRGETVTNFNSKALNRTFASITFVNKVNIVIAK
jgi:hypothetical protein